MRVISSSNPVARKNYGCDASTWFVEGVLSYGELSSYKFTFSELRAIVMARKNGWRVIKGEKHSQAAIVSCDNDLLSWRAITAIHDICQKYELYSDEEIC